MVSTSNLQRAAEWFDELCIDLVSADQPFVQPVGDRDLSINEETLVKLKKKQTCVEQYVSILRQGAAQLDWDNPSTREAYFAELATHEQTLVTGLDAMPTTEPLDAETKEELYTAATELKNCAHGILEDI